MSATILFEGRNLTLGQGTGIATYARNLTSLARDLGYDTEVVIETQGPFRSGDAALAEIMLHDAREAGVSRVERAIHRLVRGVLPAPFGMKATSVGRSGFVVDRASVLNEFDAVYAAYDLFYAADQHFSRFGRRMPLRSDSRPKLFHATHPTPIMVKGCANIYTIHDIVPLRLPYATLDKKQFFFDMLKCLARTADHIVTVSEHSRQDIMDFLGVPPDRVTNTYQAVSLPDHLVNRPWEEVDLDLKNAFDVQRGEYYLFVGTLEPKKNLSALIDAYMLSGTRRPLIVAGGLGWQYKGDLEKLEEERLNAYRLEDGMLRPARRVRHHHYVPQPQLVSLMRGARALLFPSLYEGFGLPVLEAMLLGTPVMTSNISALPEIAGDAALLASPYDRDAMARAIRTLDSDDDLRDELIRRGRVQAAEFSPESYKVRVADLYRKLL